MQPLPTALPSIGAIVYPPEQPPEAIMAAFASELAARGFRLGGLLQHTDFGSDGCKCNMEVVELDSGRRLAISQGLGKGSKSCSLDPTALAEASGAVRRAIETGVDLLVVNKFSKAEKAGDGLAGEMLDAMVRGVPLLTAVPGVLVAEWTTFTGGRGQLLMPDAAALWRWWGPRRLYQDLALGVAALPVRRVVAGPAWVLVEGPDGCGLAQMPEGAPARPDSDWAGRTLRELAEGIHSADPVETAVALAAINAHYNRFDLTARSDNGLDSFPDADDLVVVGAFPTLAERRPRARVVERRPGPGHYRAEAADWLIPAADAVIMTASTLSNRTAPHLLSLAEGRPVALVGPSAPLTPRLFRYGITVTSGLIATDPDGLARAVADGAAPRQLKRHCRPATLAAP